MTNRSASLSISCGHWPWSEFVFRGKPKDVHWAVNFDKLKSYREEYDGRDPPTSHPELGNWIKNQRNYHSKKMDGKAKHSLSDKREEKLRAVQADAAADGDYQKNNKDGSVVYDHKEEVSILPGWSSYER